MNLNPSKNFLGLLCRHSGRPIMFPQHKRAPTKNPWSVLHYVLLITQEKGLYHKRFLTICLKETSLATFRTDLIVEISAVALKSFTASNFVVAIHLTSGKAPLSFSTKTTPSRSASVNYSFCNSSLTSKNFFPFASDDSAAISFTLLPTLDANPRESSWPRPGN